jgi:hypothetical protein
LRDGAESRDCNRFIFLGIQILGILSQAVCGVGRGETSCGDKDL